MPCYLTILRLAVAAVLLCSVSTVQAEEFRIEEVTPAHQARKVEREPLIQLHTSTKFDPSTLKPEFISLLDDEGKPVKVTITGDLGGVITLSTETPLAKNSTYTIKVTKGVKDANQQDIVPFTSRFTTGNMEIVRSNAEAFRFQKTRIDLRDGVCGLALAPGHQLFACTWDGKLIRYDVSSEQPPSGGTVLLDDDQRRYISIVADPESTPERTILWLTHDALHRLSLAPNDFSGSLSRVIIEGDHAEVQDAIVGLPTGDHPTSGAVFGPDGRLYLSQGALTMLGEKPDWKETPLSAAILAVDTRAPELRPGNQPLDVRTDPPRNYDHRGGPVDVFATGIREAYDLLWHSNGQLYAGVNMNDTNEKTPGKDGLPAVSVRPDEMLLRIVEGKYYGHPNPSRNEWVLLGGNPTDEIDPWEVANLPVGTRPEKNFDPSLLIRNLKDDRGPSADGVTEWTNPGPLQGRMIICFYTATRGLHTYKFSDDGTTVIDHQPLMNEQSNPLTFGAPLDVVFDPRGHLYTADFSAPERGDAGEEGGVWMVTPVE